MEQSENTQSINNEDSATPADTFSPVVYSETIGTHIDLIEGKVLGKTSQQVVAEREQSLSARHSSEQKTLNSRIVGERSNFQQTQALGVREREGKAVAQREAMHARRPWEGINWMDRDDGYDR